MPPNHNTVALACISHVPILLSVHRAVHDVQIYSLTPPTTTNRHHCRNRNDQNTPVICHSHSKRWNDTPNTRTLPSSVVWIPSYTPQHRSLTTNWRGPKCPPETRPATYSPSPARLWGPRSRERRVETKKALRWEATTR